jgi:hypothetical protein
MNSRPLQCLILLCLIAAMLLTACGFGTTPAPVAPDATKTTPTRPADAATLSEIVNLVEAASPDQSEFARVAEGFVLNQGGQVKTGNESRVRLDMTSGAILRLGQNSLFKMEELRPGNEGPLVRLKLEFGKLWISLSGGAVEVETPVGSASVRGSFGVVEYDPSLDVLTLSCLEGRCNAENDTVKEQLGNLEQVRLTRGGQDVTRTQLTLDEVRSFTDVNPDQGPGLLSTLLAAPPPTATPATPTPTVEAKGSITGTVKIDLNGDSDADDPGEGPLAGANVTLSGCTAVSITLVTGDDGKFVFDNLPLASCQLQVEKADWDFAGVFAGDIGLPYPVQVFASATPADAATFFMRPKVAPTETTLPQPTSTEIPTPTPTATLTATPQAQIDFNADKTFLLAGECTTLRWTVLNVPAVFLDGVGVAGESTKEVCPQETTTYKLTIQTFGGVEERSLTLVITLPTPTVATTAAPDVSGPSIKILSATDPSYYGCNATTVFNVTATDQTGIKLIQIFYRYENANQAGGWWSAAVTDLGNGSYRATINNDDNATGAYNVLRGANGNIRWYVLGTDTPGNITNSGDQLVRVLACPS